MKLPLVLIDVLEAVVNSMRVEGISAEDSSGIHFNPGRPYNIIKELNEADNSITQKGSKYPMISVYMPIRENRGKLNQFYATAKIDRIVIATITEANDPVLKRFKEDGTFKTILYPCYAEFLKKLAKSVNINGGDPDAFIHTKLDNPGAFPISQGSTDYIDSIEILNLELSLLQTKTC